MHIRVTITILALWVIAANVVACSSDPNDSPDGGDTSGGSGSDADVDSDTDTDADSDTDTDADCPEFVR
jgi:hypothetical protein